MSAVLSTLPLVNAILISCSGVFMLLGVRAVRKGEEARHRRHMLTATSLAALFLIFYLTRISLGGITPFQGPASIKPVYLFVLATHVVLAMVQTPLVLAVLYHAARANVSKHRRLARITYPIWLYVSVTGVLVFALLRLPGSA